MKKKDLSIEELEKEIRRHNRLYFELQKPEISDYEFDRLCERLKKLKPDSPALAEIPIDAAPEKVFKKVRHTSEMLSLDKCYDEEDLEDWAAKFEGDVIAMPKIDGLATELRYDDKGHLILGVTRGDGLVGEDITANVRMIRDIPQKIDLPRPLLTKEGREGRSIEIRGEIYMSLSVFARHKGSFANPRNLAAGAVKQKNPRKTRDYELSFLGYDLLGVDAQIEEEKFKLLKSFRIPTTEVCLTAKDQMKRVHEHFLATRNDRDYETDGVVFKANRVDEQRRLGFTAHHPRYAIAFKFQGDTGVTTLRDVEWSVARTGVITPIGVVDPVKLSGASVTRVTLHNLGLMRALGLREGSKVVMMRRGGVIPKLESVAEPGQGKAFDYPKTCPSCDCPTEIKDDFLYCTNIRGCRRAKTHELEHFAKTAGIDNFGQKLIERLYDNGFVQDPFDFYTLKKENLLELERMGDVLADKLIANVQSHKKFPLPVFLRSLGIREVAHHASKILAEHYGTLEALMKAPEEEISAIHTIGPVIAREVVEGLQAKKPLIEKLRRYVEVEKADSKKPPPGPLSGKKFVFTGSLLTMERSKAQKLVEEKGGEAAEGVSKDLDYLVVGDGGGAGGKLEKAEKIRQKGGKLEILSEKSWKKMMELD